VEREAPIHLSNLQVVCPECGKPARVGFQVLSDGKKVRTCKACGGTIDK
jgi:large subunit ribosomal protein L24